MSDADWCIEVERQGTSDDGRPRYSCYIWIEPMPQYCSGGICGHHSPAYSREEVVQTVRTILADIRNGQWKQDDKPAPAPDNTALQDETALFTMDDFFDSGTLAAFMPETQ